MRICIIGKYPPIQGGVSMRTYWTAHALAARGHEIHVVTNAKEATPPFRMHMRPQDWLRCEAQLQTGSVKVHWSDPVDRAQSYLPMASPFVSKLASITAQVHAERPFDVIVSYYLEPYAVAGHLAAEIARVPHVVRMAGSDAGRLWCHPQLQALYNHLLRCAEIVIASGAVAERAKAHGIDPARIVSGGGFVLPEDLFTPKGPTLDCAELRNELELDPFVPEPVWGEFQPGSPYFGVYGKLGETKGSFALLAAMLRLKQSGVDVGLIALAHGRPAIEERFRRAVAEAGLTDRVLQIPFLPHWRVPEFLRGCLAVCCLEQDFPITFHTPVIPLEVLLCGKCLVGSTEVIRKLPGYERLPHGYGCVAIENVNDVVVLSARLAAMVQDPAPAVAIGLRGREFARSVQKDIAFPDRLEQILAAAASRQKMSPVKRAPASDAGNAQERRFPLTQLAAAELAKRSLTNRRKRQAVINLPLAREVLTAIENEIQAGSPGLTSLASAVRAEITIAAAENEPLDVTRAASPDPLFALRIPRWGLDDADFASLLLIRDPRLRVLKFEDDISEFRGVRTVTQLPPEPRPGPSYVVVFAGEGGARDPLLVDEATASILELSDGRVTAAEICERLKHERRSSEARHNLAWIKNLFVSGLVRLQHPE